MTPSIAKRLVQQGVIRQSTEVEAFYQGHDLSGAKLARTRGTFVIREAKMTKDQDVFFNTINAHDGSPQKIRCQDVFRIDGMDLERLTEIYGDDEPKTPSRRGRRKPLDEDGDEDFEEVAE